MVVELSTPQGRLALRARHCIVATPAPVARTLIAGLPAATAAALDQIAYGQFVSLALLTRDNGAMPWHDIYAISTPGARFSVLFNQATGLPAPQRAGRGSLMLFRGATGAAELAQLSDAALTDMARAYLRKHFPQADCHIEEVMLARWRHGAPVARVGRARLTNRAGTTAGVRGAGWGLHGVPQYGRSHHQRGSGGGATGHKR